MQNTKILSKKYPQSRGKWSEVSRPRGVDTKGVMTRYYARYAMAHGFRSVLIDGYSEHSLRGYAALLKLQLAYSAFDVFTKAKNIVYENIKKKKKELYEYNLINDQMAIRLKKCPQLICFLMMMCTSHETVRKLHLFIERVPNINEDLELKSKLSEVKRQLEAQNKNVNIINGDVLFVAASLRHGVAHGDMSLSAIGINKVSTVKLIEELADLVLKLSENEFDLLVTEVKQLPIENSQD